MSGSQRGISVFVNRMYRAKFYWMRRLLFGPWCLIIVRAVVFSVNVLQLAGTLAVQILADEGGVY